MQANPQQCSPASQLHTHTGLHIIIIVYLYYIYLAVVRVCLARDCCLANAVFVVAVVVVGIVRSQEPTNIDSPQRNINMLRRCWLQCRSGRRAWPLVSIGIGQIKAFDLDTSPYGSTSGTAPCDWSADSGQKILLAI